MACWHGPGRSRRPRWPAIYSPAVTVAGIACLAFMLLLTPTGSLPSPRWRWWARVTAAAPVIFVVALTLEPEPLDPAYQSVTNPLGLQALQLPIAITDVVASGITVAAVVVGALSLGVRFRRARGIERQQLRWVALAALLVTMTILVVLAGMALGNPLLIIWGAGVSFAILPPAIGAAILRYRLYDLDRIISRTLAWGLLTLLLGLGYAAVVLGLGGLLPEGSSLVVAAATLAMAAVFQPARRRIQHAVDRRFNRRRHDAAQTIAAFSIRLRDQVDLTTPDRGAAGRGRPDHAAHPGIALAATARAVHRNRRDGGSPIRRYELKTGFRHATRSSVVIIAPINTEGMTSLAASITRNGISSR
jgi:hypothetical protein